MREHVAGLAGAAPRWHVGHLVVGAQHEAGELPPVVRGHPLGHDKRRLREVAAVDAGRNRRRPPERKRQRAVIAGEKFPGIGAGKVAQEAFAGEPGMFTDKTVGRERPRDDRLRSHVTPPGDVQPTQRRAELRAEGLVGKRFQSARVGQLRKRRDG